MLILCDSDEHASNDDHQMIVNNGLTLCSLKDRIRII